MTVEKSHWCGTILSFLLISSVCLAHTGPYDSPVLVSKVTQQSMGSPNVDPNDSTKAFAAKLIGAQTEVERERILDENRQLLTPELTRLFLEQGRSFFRTGNLPEAILNFQVAKIIFGKIDDKLGVAQVLTTLGNIYRIQGKDAIALLHLREAATLHEVLGNKQGLFFSLLNIVMIDISQNNYDPTNLNRLSALAEESKNDQWIALSLSQSGMMQLLHGDYALSLRSHQKSLGLYERSGATEGVAFALHAIGILQRVYGNYEQALEYFQKSLALTESLRRKDLAPRSLSSIGAVYELLGNHVEALDYHQKSLSAGEFSGSQFWTIFSLNSIGEIYRAQGQFSKALTHLEMALKLSEQLGYKDRIAYVSLSIGDINYVRGDHVQALELAERAIAIARETSSRDALWKALTLAGKAYSGLNQKEKARQLLEEATNTVELLRSNVAGQELRAAYFATVQKPYEVYIDLLMQRHKQNPREGFDVLALQINERSLARSLVETLNEARSDIRHGVDAVLLERERALQRQLNMRAARQMRLSPADPESAAVRKEMSALTTEYQQVAANIRQSSPRYAALTQPVPLTMAQIQKQLLDPDTALLEYSMGESRSYLWLVTSTSHESFELPKRAELEASVRRVVQLVNDGKRWATDPQINSRYHDEATKLSRMLLPPELMSKLKAKRLLIVGDGALQYLPVGALPNLKSERLDFRLANGQKSVGNAPPLLVDHEVVTLPSASTLAVLRRETANRAQGVKTVAVIADPVFQENDERVISKKSAQTLRATAAEVEKNSSRTVLERALEFHAGETVREGVQIRRLPFTRFEAESILGTVPAQQGLKAIDFRANRETATSAELSQYRYVHFATHAILNSEHPELSGIVLSLVNEEGKPVDGFLRLHDIYNLNLPADLVVLSACQTGLGKEIRGEGLVGLTRGFMYAGAPRVLASLWKVDDAATAELMKRFYAAMLKDNLRPAAALRRAKVEMWRQKRWQAPFYWAAFELQGEWQ